MDEIYTQRDAFALAALPGVMRSMDENGGSGFGVQGTMEQIHRRTALMAYIMADHMLEARRVHPNRLKAAIAATKE